MRQVLTETITIPRAPEDTLETLLKDGELKLLKNKKQPLRTMILEVSDTEVTLLISFIYDTEE